MDISFKVTQEQKKMIESRMLENGFDEISSYLKVVALKMQAFTLSSAGSSTDEASQELGFQVTQAQKEKIEKNMKESSCKDIATYLRYVAMHGVVTAIVEVRSSGDLDAMLQRITESRRSLKLKKLF